MFKLARSKPFAAALRAATKVCSPKKPSLQTELQIKSQQLDTPARSSAVQQKRFLSIHEYLSANLLKTYGIGVPNGEVARSAAEAESIAKKIGMRKLQKEV